MLLQIQQDRRCLKDGEVPTVPVLQHRDAPVGIETNEPRFLLRAFRDVDLVDASWYQGATRYQF